MSNLVPALKAELAELERELQADPRYHKMTRIRDLLRTYEGDADVTKRDLAAALTPPPPPWSQHSAPPMPPPPPPPNWATSWPSSNGVLPHLPPIPGRPASKIERVKSEIRELLSHKIIAHRKEILAHLTDRGVMGHEKDPMASLAAYLSGFKDDFVFDGNGNYSLKPS
jgi:hypothetical protein